MGLLGADLERDDDRLWRVTRVLPAETSDPRARSPLAAPGTRVSAGDAVLAVNGQAGGRHHRARPAAGRLGGDPRRADHRAGRRRSGAAVVVRPLYDDHRLRYQAWVADRRGRAYAS